MKNPLFIAILSSLAILPLPAASIAARAAQGIAPAAQATRTPSPPGKGDAIVASGVLAGGKDCQLLRTPSGETYVLLGQLPRTTAGDRVRVSGRRGGKTACQEGPSILVEGMRLEGYEPAARQPGQPFPPNPAMVSHGPGPMDDARAGKKGQPKRLQVTGTLAREGVQCPILRTAKGGIYTLAGDLKGFQTGARVTVTGTQASASGVCQRGPTITVENVRPAPPTRRR